MVLPTYITSIPKSECQHVIIRVNISPNLYITTPVRVDNLLNIPISKYCRLRLLYIRLLETSCHLAKVFGSTSFRPWSINLDGVKSGGYRQQDYFNLNTLTLNFTSFNVNTVHFSRMFVRMSSRFLYKIVCSIYSIFQGKLLEASTRMLRLRLDLGLYSF